MEEAEAGKILRTEAAKAEAETNIYEAEANKIVRTEVLEAEMNM